MSGDIVRGPPEGRDVAVGSVGGLTLTRRAAAHGILLAAPASVVAVFSPPAGLALAVGMLPCAAVGLPDTRRARHTALLVGAVAAAALLSGSLVAASPLLAVAVVLVLCVAIAAWASRTDGKLASMMLTLGVPLVGAGLSISPWADGLAAAALVLAGCVYGWLVSLAWPQRNAPTPPRVAPPRSASLTVYGVQVGLAGAAGAAAGYALGADHPGWACASALLVSRPDRDILRARGRERSVAATAGALLACGVAALSPPPWAIALVVALALCLATSLVGSRWYYFPFFSTLLLLSALLIGETERPAHWFVERVGLTLLGIALALLAARIVPAAAERLARVRAGAA